jgi:hypothetical protein
MPARTSSYLTEANPRPATRSASRSGFHVSAVTELRPPFQQRSSMETERVLPYAFV